MEKRFALNGSQGRLLVRFNVVSRRRLSELALLTAEHLDAELSSIITRLRDVLRPSIIYLFGSYAYGTPSRDSDIDLLVIVEDSDLTAYERDAAAYRSLKGIRLPIDVQVYTRREFDERAALRVSFERTVKAKGKIVYAA